MAESDTDNATPTFAVVAQDKCRVCIKNSVTGAREWITHEEWKKRKKGTNG